MPVAGRGGDFEPIAARCRAEKIATDGMIRVMVRYGDALALTYMGELDLADQRVAEYAEFSSAGQFRAGRSRRSWPGSWPRTAADPQAVSSIEQALAALAAERRCHGSCRKAAISPGLRGVGQR